MDPMLVFSLFLPSYLSSTPCPIPLSTCSKPTIIQFQWSTEGRSDIQILEAWTEAEKRKSGKAEKRKSGKAVPTTGRVEAIGGVDRGDDRRKDKELSQEGE